MIDRIDAGTVALGCLVKAVFGGGRPSGAGYWASALGALAVTLSVVIACAPTPSSPESRAPGKESPQPGKAPASSDRPQSAIQPLQAVKISYPALSGAMGVLAVAKEEGIFEKYGLDVELVYIAGSPVLLASMLAGEVPFAHVGADPIIQANLQGADLVLLTGTISKVMHTIYSVPNITRVEQLKGKRIGVSRLGSNEHFNTRRALRQAGMDPDQDVVFLQAGGNPERLAALESGALDATPLVSPATIEAQRRGLYPVLDLASMNIPYQANALVTTRSFLKENEIIVKNLVKAMVESVWFGKTHKEAAIAAMAKHLSVSDQEILEEVYRVYFLRAYQEVPYPTMEGIQAILDFLSESDPAAGRANPRDFVEVRYLKELEDSGFIRRLYGR